MQGMKQLRFSANILLYLGNDTRYNTSYYGVVPVSIATSDLELSYLAKYSMTRSTRSLSATAELLVLLLARRVYNAGYLTVFERTLEQHSRVMSYRV